VSEEKKRYILTEESLLEVVEKAMKYGMAKADIGKEFFQIGDLLKKQIMVPNGALGFYVIDENGDPKCLKIPDQL